MIHIKDYISYSQFKLFMQSPESYKKVYIFGYRFSNKYTEFGSKIHKVLEDRVATDKDGEMALKLMPKAQKREVIVEAELGGVPVYGKIDGVNKTKTGYSIIDYKTSKKGWTQRQVDKSEQLTFYVAMFCSLNKIPMDSLKVWLNCLRTFEDIDGSIHLTGEKQNFETHRSKADLDKLIPDIRFAWVGIGQLIEKCAKG